MSSDEQLMTLRRSKAIARFFLVISKAIAAAKNEQRSKYQQHTIKLYEEI